MPSISAKSTDRLIAVGENYPSPTTAPTTCERPQDAQISQNLSETDAAPLKILFELVKSEKSGVDRQYGK